MTFLTYSRLRFNKPYKFSFENLFNVFLKKYCFIYLTCRSRFIKTFKSSF